MWQKEVERGGNGKKLSSGGKAQAKQTFLSVVLGDWS